MPDLWKMGSCKINYISSSAVRMKIALMISDTSSFTRQYLCFIIIDCILNGVRTG